jgi:hypothetical protein
MEAIKSFLKMEVFGIFGSFYNGGRWGGLLDI